MPKNSLEQTSAARVALRSGLLAQQVACAKPPALAHAERNAPLVVAGVVDTIDITSAGTNVFAWNHDVYAASPIIVADMERILMHGTRPPSKRTQEFEPSEDGTYWRLRSPRAPAQWEVFFQARVSKNLPRARTSELVPAPGSPIG